MSDKDNPFLSMHIRRDDDDVLLVKYYLSIFFNFTAPLKGGENSKLAIIEDFQKLIFHCIRSENETKI